MALLVTATALSVSAGATQHAGDYMFFAFDDRVSNSDNNEHMKISGNENVFSGKIKSNGDIHISGNDNDYLDTVRYYDENSISGTGNTYPGGEPAQEAFVGTWPGTLGASFDEPDCDFGSRANNSLDNVLRPDDDADGVYCWQSADVSVPSDEDWPDCGSFNPPPWPQPCESFTPKK